MSSRNNVTVYSLKNELLLDFTGSKHFDCCQIEGLKCEE